MYPMVVDKPVTHCICANVSFEEVKQSGALSLEEATALLGVGKQCRGCRPYITKVMETGEVAFAVLPDSDAF